MRPYAPPTFPEDNPFYRDAAADGPEAVALVRRRAARFFRDARRGARARARPRSRVVVSTRRPCPRTATRAWTTSCRRARAWAPQRRVRGAGDAPYCVDVCRALASLECHCAQRARPRARAACRRTRASPRGRRGCCGYVAGLGGEPPAAPLASLDGFCSDEQFVAGLKVREYVEKGCALNGVATSDLVGRAREPCSTRLTTRWSRASPRCVPRCSTRPAAPRRRRLADSYFDVLEAGALATGGRTLAVLRGPTAAGEPLLVEFRPCAKAAPRGPTRARSAAAAAAAVAYGGPTASRPRRA